MTAILDQLPRLERALVARGFPAMSPWWRATFERFYRSGCRQLVLRAGRRAGKSSSLCRIAVLEALYGGHRVPPGDVGVVAIVSVTRDEGAQRLRTVRAILDALGIEYRPVEHGIELVGRRTAFKVFAGSVAGVVGFTCIGAICDEVSRWRDADTGANPAREVLASLRPTMATQPRARLFLSSSPLGLSDAHATAFEQGETDFQCVAYAPTWEANPTVTEADTHALEPDERVWRREYLAVPQTGTLSAFDTDAIERTFEPHAEGTPCRPAIIIDASSGRADAWTWGVARWVTLPATHYLRFELVDGVQGRFWGQTSGAEIVGRVASVARAYGASDVHGDQRESLMLRSEFASHGLLFREHAWTASSKPPAVELLRSLMRDGRLALPEHDGLRRELLAFEERMTPSGAFTFGARGAAHDDYVALLITAALAHLAGDLMPYSGDLYDPSFDRLLPLLSRLEGGDREDDFMRCGVADAAADDPSRRW